MICKECDKAALFASLCREHWQQFWESASVDGLNTNAELIDVIMKIIGPWELDGLFFVTSCCGRLFVGTDVSTKCGTCGNAPVFNKFDKSAKQFVY